MAKNKQLYYASIVQRHHAYVVYFNARIQSGAYKTRQVFKGGHNGPQLTEQELLEDELKTMLTHINRMNEAIDEMCKEENSDGE